MIDDSKIELTPDKVTQLSIELNEYRKTLHPSSQKSFFAFMLKLANDNAAKGNRQKAIMWQTIHDNIKAAKDSQL
jgi:hypothetical protein